MLNQLTRIRVWWAAILITEKQAELFDGCVFVEESNRSRKKASDETNISCSPWNQAMCGDNFGSKRFPVDWVFSFCIDSLVVYLIVYGFYRIVGLCAWLLWLHFRMQVDSIAGTEKCSVTWMFKVEFTFNVCVFCAWPSNAGAGG